ARGALRRDRETCRGKRWSRWNSLGGLFAGSARGGSGGLGPQYAVESVEAAGPKQTVLREPVLQPGETTPIERPDARLAFGAHGDEPGLAQHLQVLRHGGRTEVELLDQLSGGPLALGEQFDDAAPGRVGEGKEALHAGHI